MDPGDRALLNFVKGLGYVIGFLAIVIALGVLYFRYYDGMTEAISKPIEGMVIDHVTEQPIAGAVVAANWLVGYSNWHGGGEACYRGLAVETDAQGRFHFDAWRENFASKKTTFNIQFAVYRRGYFFDYTVYDRGKIDQGFIFAKFTKWLWLINSRTRMIDAKNVRLRMKPSPGTVEDRMREVRSFTANSDCSLPGPDPIKYPDYALLYQRILEELRQFPDSYENKEQQMRYYQERLQGFTERDEQ
ncbi:MAG: hypothetical protein ACKVQA_03185 [Burkholderiales bacterium]